MNSAPAAIIFDFDGVIVLSEPVHVKAWHVVAEKFGRTLPQGWAETGVGKHDDGMARELEALFGDTIPWQRLLEAKRLAYQELAPEVQFVPGLLEMLNHLHGKYPLGVATMSCRADIEPSLAVGNLHQYFDSIMTLDDVQAPKPAPEIYLESARRLGVAPDDCWVFEDSVTGTQAAIAAGMHVIGISTTHHPTELPGIETVFPNYHPPEVIERFILRQMWMKHHTPKQTV